MQLNLKLIKNYYNLHLQLMILQDKIKRQFHYKIQQQCYKGHALMYVLKFMKRNKIQLNHMMMNIEIFYYKYEIIIKIL